LFETYIQPLIVAYGCWAVFFVIMFEATGVPLPGESALVAAGVYAGATGHLSILNIIVAAAAGAITGDNFGFWLGRAFGTRLLERYGKFVGLTPNRLHMGRYLFERHGGKIVFFGRFVAFLRVFAALLAGANRYPWPSFLFYNAAGGITWATVVSLAAFVFGDAITKVSGIVGFVGLALALAGIAAFMIVLSRQEKKLEAHFAAEMQRKEGQAPALDTIE
jgi:membrane protein DedA with SNARE-associated domain